MKNFFTISIALISYVFASAQTASTHLYKTTYLKQGYPDIKNFKTGIDEMMRGRNYTIESSILETGTDTVTGFFTAITVSNNDPVVYSFFLAKKDSVIYGQHGVVMTKDTSNYIKTDLNIISLKYNIHNKKLLYRWIDGFQIGNEFPELRVVDLKGSEINVKDIRDKIVVINWWRTSCGPCILEMPELNQIVSDYSKNKEIIFLAIADNSSDELNSFLQRKEFRYNQFIRTNSTKKILGSSTPVHLIKDKQGKIALYLLGGGKGIGDVLKYKIDQLINKN